MNTFLILFPIMIIFIIRIVINSGNDKQEKQKTAEFYERERKANFSRNKDISSLEMFNPTLDKLPFHDKSPDSALCSLEKNVKKSATESMMDFHEYTNTDLKLMYGVGNFTTIATYDQNFMYFTRNLFNWGKYLYENNYTDDACTVLEYLISITNNNSSAFTILAKIYNSYNQPEKISELINLVEQYEDSISKRATLNSLKNIINSY